MRGVIVPPSKLKVKHVFSPQGFCLLFIMGGLLLRGGDYVVPFRGLCASTERPAGQPKERQSSRCEMPQKRLYKVNILLESNPLTSRILVWQFSNTTLLSKCALRRLSLQTILCVILVYDTISHYGTLYHAAKMCVYMCMYIYIYIYIHIYIYITYMAMLMVSF